MKLTAEQKKTARHLFEIMPKRAELFINDKGEFFTNENYALNSVSQDASKVLKFTRTEVVEAETKAKAQAEAEAKAKPQGESKKPAESKTTKSK